MLKLLEHVGFLAETETFRFVQLFLLVNETDKLRPDVKHLECVALSKQ